jgi:hypothetical protein
MKIRANYLEEKIRQLFVSYLHNVQSYESNNSLHIMKQLMELNNGNKIFHDAESPYFTINNHAKKTEFVIHAPMYNIFWRIECKSQVKYSNMVTRLYDELYYVSDLPEDKIFFILDGALLYPKIIKEFTDRIKKFELINKVWVGGINSFEQKLIKQLRA